MPFLSEYVIKCVTIRREQKEWLAKQNNINFSGFVQDQLDLWITVIEKQKRKDEKTNPLYTNN